MVQETAGGRVDSLQNQDVDRNYICINYMYLYFMQGTGRQYVLIEGSDK